MKLPHIFSPLQITKPYTSHNHISHLIIKLFVCIFFNEIFFPNFKVVQLLHYT